MAPSRRRGVSKASSAAAAAAARRQWKVGDLVLAKVKGFPAWPATVSEPEKWGYSTDWKKVLVYFFGTKQIAFCNPADVEAFTEEKKKSLLAKRHGKGADFGRAVQEIIDCYENLKAQEQDDEGNSGHEDIDSNAGNSEGSGGRTGTKLQARSPSSERNSLLESLYISSHHPLEVSAATEIANLKDRETTYEEPDENSPSFDYLKKTSAATNSLKRKSKDAGLQSFVVQKRASARRSRSTLKVDPSKFQTYQPLTDSSMDDGDLVSNVIHERSARRNRRAKRSPDSYVWHDTVSPGYSTALVSNGSSEGNDAEIALANSDAVSFNEGITIESSCKSEHLRIDSLEKDVQLSNRLHLRDEGVVLKKKRKPNRKRASHDAAASTFSPKKESGMELPPFKFVENSASVCEKVHEATSRANGEEQLLCVLPNSLNACEKVCDHKSKADGDEHLPLVKRARVRMGKPPSEEKQPTGCPVDMEGKSMQEALVNHSKPMSSLSACANSSHGSGDVMVSVDKPPPSENKQPTRDEKLPTDCSIAKEGKSTQKALVNHSQPMSSLSACVNNSHSIGAMMASMGKPLPEEKQPTDLLYKEGISMQEALVNHSQPMSPPSFCVNNSHSIGMTLEVLLPPNCVDLVESEHPFWKASKYQPNCSADGEAALPPSKRLHRALEAMSANAVEDGQTYIEDGETPKAISSSGCSGSSEKDFSHISMEDKVKSVANMEDVTSGDNGTCVNGGVGFSPGFTSHVPEVETTSSEVKLCDPPVGFSFSPEHGNVNMMMMMKMKTRNIMDVKNLEASSVTATSDSGETDLNSLQSIFDIDQKQDVHESSVCTLNHVLPVEKGDKHGILGQSAESTDMIFKTEFAHSLEEKSGQEQSATRPKRSRLDSLAEVKEVSMLSNQSGDNSVLSIANGNSCKDKDLLISPPHKNVEAMYGDLTEFKDDLAYKDIDSSLYSTSMKVLIAAAQAKRNLSRSTSVSESVMVCDAVSSSPFGRRIDSYEKASPAHNKNLHVSTAESRNHPLHDESGSPDAPPHFKKATHVEMDEGNVGPSSSHRQKSSGKWANSEASAARKGFESMLGTLTRTKESIGRATRLAIDCAKYGIASEVLEILVRNLESESSLHRRVDLFFLVDSITQCSRGQKGGVGEVYPSAVQAILPRLLSAAAPPGSAARENRKQCLKVLRLWLERKTLPESIIRRHMRELDSTTDVSYSSARSRRPSRMERAMNDPIREMEGMLVDEYGSNASFNLPGFSMPRMLEDEEGSDPDERSFEAVTPEPDPEIEREATPVSTTEKHCHILEDVDGELEMEDVAPSHDVERSSAGDIVRVDAVHPLHCHVEPNIPVSFAPPLPEDHPPTPPPLPSSPPPMPPPRPPQSSMCRPFTECADSKLYRSTHGMQTHLQQHISRPLCTSGVKSMVLDTVHNYAPGYRDFGKQAPRPSSSSIPGSSSSFSIPQVHMLTGNSVQHVDSVRHVDSASLHNQNFHVHPPPPTLSNQFSYVHTDQSRQSWMETSSSFTKSYQFRPDFQGESRYDTRERVELAPVEIGGRCKISAPMHSGLRKSDKPEASYVPVSHYGPPHGPQILDRGWSFPPREVNYRHPTPSRPPPHCTIAGANGALNYWIPR